MAPPAGEGEGEQPEHQPAPHQPEQAQEEPPPPSPEPEPQVALGPIPIYVVYRCPLFWCPIVICQWIGPNHEMYDHFVLEWEHHGNDVVEVKDADGPVLCEWPNYVQTCDIADEETGLYRVLMRTHRNMIFFLSAKANNNGTTGLHVIYIGEAERAYRYSCNICIENGAEVAAPIYLTLACGRTDGMTDIIAIDPDFGVTLDNDDLKSCCAANGSLFFWIELQIPEGEEPEENPVVIDVAEDD